MRLDEVQIELSGVCNTVCSYCTWQKRTAGRRLMATDLACRLLGEARDMGVRLVRCHGIGEPLLHADVLRIVAYGLELGLAVSVSTNASLLEGAMADGFRALAGLELVLSVHGVTPDKFSARAAGNVCDYLALPNRNSQVHVQMICSADALGHYAGFMDTFLPLVERAGNASLFLKQPLTWPKSPPVAGFRPAPAGHPRVVIDPTPAPLSIGRICDMPARFLFVMADGTCAPCCVGTDDWGLPNAADAGLAGVWESRRMEELRTLWSAAADEIACGHCKKRRDC